MNSVALPASASTTALSGEADLVRQAARGDADAFGELFRRHSAPAWRLAQAVTADRESAVTAFREGFVRSVKAGRFNRRATTTFRPHVLSSVYRAAIDQAYDRAAAPAPARRAAADSPEAVLANAAFRSLPERWRAAIWLNEVENLDSERIGGVLGVSASVAEQLVARGRRGLAGRFAQAHHEMPQHVGEVLRPLTLAPPSNLSEVTRASWSTAGTDHMSVVAPVTGWLEDRAIRPMSVAVGALVGLGLIGLGVVPGGAAVRSPLSQGTTSTLPGAVSSCLGLPCPGGTAGTSTGATTTGAGGGLAGANSVSGFPSSFAAGGAGAGGFGAGTGTLASGPGTGTGVGTGAGTSPTQTGGGTPTSHNPSPNQGTGGGTPLVTLPGGAGSVSSNGSGTSTNLITNVGGSNGLTLSGGSSGLSGSVGGTPLPTNSITSTLPTVPAGSTGPLPSGSGTSTSSSTPSTTNPIQSVTSTVSNAVSGAAQTITSTVTTLLPGL